MVQQKGLAARCCLNLYSYIILDLVSNRFQLFKNQNRFFRNVSRDSRLDIQKLTYKYTRAFRPYFFMFIING